MLSMSGFYQLKKGYFNSKTFYAMLMVTPKKKPIVDK